MKEALTPVVFELDSIYDASGEMSMRLLAKSASETAYLAEMRNALSASGTANDIHPILSSNATTQDIAFFRANPHRTHRLREAISNETVLVGRVPPWDFVVLVRQIRSGLRVLAAIDRELIHVDPKVREARIDNDEVLALAWEAVTRAAPGSHIYLGEIVACAERMRSAAATVESTSNRQLS